MSGVVKIDRGVVVWISVDHPRPGVAEAVILEIESRVQEQVRLRDATGTIAIRNVQELHATESAALRARIDQEAHWARRYRDMSDACVANAMHLRRRLAQRTATPIRSVR